VNNPWITSDALPQVLHFPELTTLTDLFSYSQILLHE
jgi:hypothetical protein